MIGNFLDVLNLTQLFFKLNQLVCNYTKYCINYHLLFGVYAMFFLMLLMCFIINQTIIVL